MTGDLIYVAGTKGKLFQNEWLGNYKTVGLPLAEKMLRVPSEYYIVYSERAKQIDDFAKAHPGEVGNSVGHSKGAAVIDVWMKNRPDLTRKSRLHATPYEDMLGEKGLKDKLTTCRAVEVRVGWGTRLSRQGPAS